MVKISKDYSRFLETLQVQTSRSEREEDALVDALVDALQFSAKHA